jgi:hypothetical protein
VVSRNLLLTLVYVFVVLIVVLAVVGAFAALAARLDDPQVVSTLQAAATITAVLLAVDSLLLIGALGIEAIERSRQDP